MSRTVSLCFEVHLADKANVDEVLEHTAELLLSGDVDAHPAIESIDNWEWEEA